MLLIRKIELDWINRDIFQSWQNLSLWNKITKEERKKYTSPLLSVSLDNKALTKGELSSYY